MAVLKILLLLTVIRNSITSIAQNCTDSRLRRGSCIALNKCPNLIEEFYAQARGSPNGIDFQTFIGDSICGFDGTNFLICCAFSVGQVQQGVGIGETSTTSFPKDTFEVVPKPQAFTAQQQTADALFTFVSLGGSPATVSTPVVYSPVPVPVVYSPVPNPVSFSPVPGSATVSSVFTGQQTSASSSCGISKGTTNRVVGGIQVKKGAYPWMSALGYYEEYDRNTLKFLCAGSLITSVHVVTSAHCINPQLTLVRLGALDISKTSEPDAIDIRIKRSIVHELFDLKSIANDIAIIELQSPAPMTNFIRPICLPESSNFLTQDFVGWNPFIAGWGARQHQGSTSNVLLDAQVPIVSRSSCEQSYRSVFKFVEFSDKLICAGNSNVDACQGDSGGPLMMPQSDGAGDFRFYLLGIVSYGYECARSGFPGVYTRVASYIPWIKQKIQ